MEPGILTTVRVDSEDHRWVKQNEATWRAVIKAGIRRLKDGSEIEVLRERIRSQELEMSRNSRRKAIIEWLFYNETDAYERAVKAVLQQESKGD